MTFTNAMAMLFFVVAMSSYRAHKRQFKMVWQMRYATLPADLRRRNRMR